MQRRLIQTKVNYNSFHSVSKEMTRKSPKVAASKTFPPVYMLWIQLASVKVFYSIWQLEVIVFCKSLSLLRDCFSRHIVAFFETSVLKEVRILRYLRNSAVLIPKFQNKTIVYLT